jgi:hypothetical protein
MKPSFRREAERGPSFSDRAEGYYYIGVRGPCAAGTAKVCRPVSDGATPGA